jgi:hypothetical protein
MISRHDNRPLELAAFSSMLSMAPFDPDMTLYSRFGSALNIVGAEGIPTVERLPLTGIAFPLVLALR